MFNQPIYKIGMKPKNSPYVNFSNDIYKTKGGAMRMAEQLNNGLNEREKANGSIYKIYYTNNWKEM